MSTPAAVLWWGAAALLAAGLLLVVCGFIGDRSRGRRRCPRCWYLLVDPTSRRCPECGHEARSERQLHRPRRRRWALAGGSLFLLAGASTVVAQVIRSESHWKAIPTSLLIEIVPPTGSIFAIPSGTWRAAALDELSRRHGSGLLTSRHEQRWATRIAEAQGKPRIAIRPVWPSWVSPLLVVDRRNGRARAGAPWDDIIEGHRAAGPSPEFLIGQAVPGHRSVLSASAIGRDTPAEVDVVFRRHVQLGSTRVELADHELRVSFRLDHDPIRAADRAFDEVLARSLVVAVDRQFATAWVDVSSEALGAGDIAVGGGLELLRDGRVVATCVDAVGSGGQTRLLWLDTEASMTAGSPRIGIPETIEWLDRGGALHTSPARGSWQVRVKGDLRAALLEELLRATDAPPDRPWRWATRWWAGSVTIDLHDAGLERPAVSRRGLEWIAREIDPAPGGGREPAVASFMRPTPGEFRGFLFE